MSQGVFANVPAKLILFGEWSVLNGHLAIGLPLNSSFHLSAVPSKTTTLVSQNSEFGDDHDLFTHNEWAIRIKTCLDQTLPISQNFEYTSHREWPLNEGLGSSSALFLSLLEIRESLLGIKLSWNQVLSIFKSVEHNKGSGLDLAIQRYRCPITYKNFKPTKLENFAWPKELVLLHGHKKQITSEAIQKISPTNEHIKGLSESCEKFLMSPKSDVDWIEAMDSHFEILSDLGVVPSEALDLKKQIGHKAGIKSIKTVGAGGMDSLLVWSENPDELRNSTENLNELGWYISHHKALI